VSDSEQAIDWIAGHPQGINERNELVPTSIKNPQRQFEQSGKIKMPVSDSEQAFD
jgi:hypothetical protein